jgi:hypothetical protein
VDCSPAASSIPAGMATDTIANITTATESDGCRRKDTGEVTDTDRAKGLHS